MGIADLKKKKKIDLDSNASNTIRRQNGVEILKKVVSF